MSDDLQLLADLRRARGEALLAGRKFDSSAIAAARERDDAEADKQAAAVRRDREASARAGAERSVKLRTQIASLEDQRLAAVEDAEAAARELVDAIGRLLEISNKMAGAAHALSGEAAPIPLQAPSVVSRLSGRLASVLATIPGHRARFGGIEWRGGGLYKADMNWRDAEQALLAKHLHPLINKDKANGTDSQS